MFLTPLDGRSRLERRIVRLDASIAVLDASLDNLVAGSAAADLARNRIQKLSIERQRTQAQLDRSSNTATAPSLEVIVPTEL